MQYSLFYWSCILVIILNTIGHAQKQQINDVKRVKVIVKSGHSGPVGMQVSKTLRRKYIVKCCSGFKCLPTVDVTTRIKRTSLTNQLYFSKNLISTPATATSEKNAVSMAAGRSSATDARITIGTSSVAESYSSGLNLKSTLNIMENTEGTGLTAADQINTTNEAQSSRSPVELTFSSPLDGASSDTTAESETSLLTTSIPSLSTDSTVTSTPTLLTEQTNSETSTTGTTTTTTTPTTTKFYNGSSVPTTCVPLRNFCWMSNSTPCEINQTAKDLLYGSSKLSDKYGYLKTMQNRTYYVGNVDSAGKINPVNVYKICCERGFKIYEPSSIAQMKLTNQIIGTTSLTVPTGDTESINQTHEVWCRSRQILPDSFFNTGPSAFRYPCVDEMMLGVNKNNFLLQRYKYTSPILFNRFLYPQNYTPVSKYFYIFLCEQP